MHGVYWGVSFGTLITWAFALAATTDRAWISVSLTDWSDSADFESSFGLEGDFCNGDSLYDEVNEMCSLCECYTDMCVSEWAAE